MIEGALSAGAVLAGALAYGMYSPNSRLFGPVIGRGPAESRAIYLTFDDGPSLSATESILGTLDERRAPAAFFLLGKHVERHPELARHLAEAGHEIGNHTYRHRKLHLRGPGWIARELRTAHEVIAAASRREPRAFRAPHGLHNPFVHASARALGYTMFGWTLGVWDSDRPGAEAIRRRVREGLRPGAIVLLHDGDGYDPDGDRSQTAAALPGIIDDARGAGYEIRPIGDLIP